MESQDTAAFVVTLGPSRSEYVRQVLGTARATLARSRGNEFRDADEPLGVHERRSRGGGLPRGRTQPAATPAPPDASVPTWPEERDAVLQAIVGLREWCETLSDQLAEVQKRPAHALYREMAKWGDAECARIEQESLQQQQESLQQQRTEEPLEVPALHTLRQ